MSGIWVTKGLSSSTVCKLDSATLLHLCLNIHGLLEGLCP